MKQQLLLVKDVESLGRSGEVVEVRTGYARNFLLPQQLALVANKHTLRLQTKLQEERARLAVIDMKEAEELSERIKQLGSVTIIVKVDPEGHLYGSVTDTMIADAVQKAGLPLEKRYVKLQKQIKNLGTVEVPIVLKEGVKSSIFVIVEKEMTLEELKIQQEQKIREQKALTDKPE